MRRSGVRGMGVGRALNDRTGDDESGREGRVGRGVANVGMLVRRGAFLVPECLFRSRVLAGIGVRGCRQVSRCISRSLQADGKFVISEGEPYPTRRSLTMQHWNDDWMAIKSVYVENPTSGRREALDRTFASYA